MIYNRYIPSSDGVYKRHCVCTPDEEPKHTAIPLDVKPDAHSTRQGCSQPHGIDLGDILLLCIVILLISEADGNDTISILAAIAAFIFIQ